ncbi:ROK family transcriptional regulator [Sphingomonas sp.]|uniref:ROK family protein n=1 Tax=Sphingomonas sp. TaxID=28214 RepID=UPI002EDAE6AE
MTNTPMMRRDHAMVPSEGREARLSVSLSGTNLARAGDYNQRIVLQAIRVAGETTRTALAEITGLTPPTIANITRHLLQQKLIVPSGRNTGTRGQPAVRLTINPDGAFAIGVNLDGDHLTILLVDLGGQVRYRSTHQQAFTTPDQVVALLKKAIGAMRDATPLDDRRVLGIGIALPRQLGDGGERPPTGYEAWAGVDIRHWIGPALPWPVHVDHEAAAAAIGEARFGSGLTLSSFFYVLIGTGLSGGLVVDGCYFRGADARSGAIGSLPDVGAGSPRTVQDTVSLTALFARLAEAGHPSVTVDGLLSDDPTVAAIVARWIEDAARALIEPLVSVHCLIDPGAVLIGGRLPAPLIDRLVIQLRRGLAQARIPSPAPVLRARISDDAAAVGAAILPFLDRVLPSDAILMQAGRG